MYILHIYIYIYVIKISIHVHIHIHVCIETCIQASNEDLVCTYTCVSDTRCIYTHIYTYTRTYVYAYTYIYTVQLQRTSIYLYM